jgi:hypothetical protein
MGSKRSICQACPEVLSHQRKTASCQAGYLLDDLGVRRRASQGEQISPIQLLQRLTEKDMDQSATTQAYVSGMKEDLGL